MSSPTPFISFPSIPQYKNIVKRVRSGAEYHRVPLPTIKFVGTVKIHGTNGAVLRPVSGSPADIYVQSRERLLNPLSDNFGFAAFVQQQQAELNVLLSRAAALRPNATGHVQLYGEWCGAGIQKKVGVSNLSKMFVIFAARVSDNAESVDWFSPTEIESLFPDDKRPTGIFTKMDFQHWTIDIDFSNPAAVQNTLVDITAAVEADCPVTRKLIPTDDPAAPISRIGEGVVWEAVSTTEPTINIQCMMMKVKGDKHTKAAHDKNKTTVLASVDEARLNSIQEFVEYAVTDSRLEQGLMVLTERGLDNTDTKYIGDYIRWIAGDIVKEELDALSNSNLTYKDVSSAVANVARNFYLSRDE